MTLTSKQQIIEQIKRAKNILVVFKDIEMGIGYPRGGDAVSSALALYQILLKNKKNVDVASPNFSPKKEFLKISKIEDVKNNIQATGIAKISLDIKSSGLKNFSYEVDGDNLHIKLEPKYGSLNLETLKTKNGAWQYDLIFVLDSPNLKALGNIYKQNKKMFDALPIINIDNSPHNEHFGEINLVDIKKSSTAEVLWNIIGESKNADKDIINCILGGIISKTKNFKHPNIKSETLNLVAELMALGGNRQKIVEGFYRTKSIENLKLWGRTLARLKHKNGITWSLLARTDFIHCSADEDMLPDVIHELISTSADTDIIVLLHETEDNKIKAIIHSQKTPIEIPELDINHVPATITSKILPQKNLVEAERELIAKLK